MRRPVFSGRSDFLDVQALAGEATKVRDARGEFNHLGRAWADMICERHGLEVCPPRTPALHENAFHARRKG